MPNPKQSDKGLPYTDASQVLGGPIDNTISDPGKAGLGGGFNPKGAKTPQPFKKGKGGPTGAKGGSR